MFAMSGLNRKASLLFLLLLSVPALARDLAVEDAFSPRQGATKLIVDTIDGAHKSIRVAAYSFTSRPIGEALVSASRNGIDVRVVLDKSQNCARSLAAFLKESGVPMRINSHYAIMHNKFMIIDNNVLELGSFNYTEAAEERNAENVLVIRDTPQVISDYNYQWEKLWAEGEKE
jgi:phosphatidylserine/phosphatidylglycerophosphate/cardiolipin synthase-like enzyme